MPLNHANCQIFCLLDTIRIIVIKFTKYLITYWTIEGPQENWKMIRKLKTGEYRLYSLKKNPKTGKRRNLGTFTTRVAAEKHEREIQFFKRR